IVKELLDFLDAKVGKGRYLLALTGDHGVCPLVKVTQARGQDAGQLDPKDLLGEADTIVRQRFGKEGDKTRWVEAISEGGIYLNRRVITDQELKQADVENILAEELLKRPKLGIQTVYTRTQLVNGQVAKDPLGERVRLSFHEKRSGDILV